MTTKPFTALIAALFLASFARAAEAPKKTPELVAKGQASFARYCASCHGPKGEGDGPAARALKPKPRNLLTEPLKSPGAAGVHETLTNGVKGTAMMPFKHLSDEDRWALSYYVVSLKDGPKK
jgi:mono/diheme cytochrome c family protein